MTHLPTITVVAVTTKDYGPTIAALHKTLEQIDPYDVLYFSDVPYTDPAGRIHHVKIDRFTSVKDYNRFMVKELGKYLESDHILVVQHDGYVINGNAWHEEFLQYDYIGAPWTYTDGRNVGNGGFSLRSAKLHVILSQDPHIEMYSPEDEVICRFYRQYLEEKHGIRFAPDQVAHKFSFEMHRPKCRTFGFHNYFHQQYKEPVILRRSGAMGDVIMMEPVMEYFHNKGYRVIIDTQPQYFNLFAKHFFPVEYLGNIAMDDDMAEARVINLDMAYETRPQELILASYYHTCGITDGVMRNSKLNFTAPADKQEIKLFDKYVIMHTDDTAMAHRNVHGVDWDKIAKFIEVELGYPVFRVGRGNGYGGTKINTYSENMLAYIVGNASYFIGLDSGCGHIAVSCGVPSMLFFGSVRPELRYPDLSNIMVMQNPCPADRAGCYHSVISEVGRDCEVDVKRPPCIGFDTNMVSEKISEWI